MLYSKARATKRLLVYATFFLVVAAFGAMLYANGKKWYERWKQEKEIAAIEQEIARLKEEERAKGVFLEQLKSPFFIEKEGREKFGAKKEGESVVLFPKFEEEEEGDVGAKKQQASPPFFRHWLQYFFH